MKPNDINIVLSDEKKLEISDFSNKIFIAR